MSTALIELKDTFLSFVNKTNSAINIINAQISDEQLQKLNTDDKETIVSAINEVLKKAFKVSGGTVEGNLTTTGYLSTNTTIRIGSNNNGDSIIQLFDDKRNMYKELKWNTEKDDITIEDNNGIDNIILHENQNIDCSKMNIDLQLKSTTKLINEQTVYKSGECIYLTDDDHIAYHNGVKTGGHILSNMDDIKTIEQVRVSSIDTTAGFLNEKIIAGSGIYLEKNNGGANEQLKIQTGLRAGLVNFWPGNYNSIPTGWIICDGRTLNRTEYSDLYNAIGTLYGYGDGKTTFNIPNYLGKFLFGMDSSTNIATTGGEKQHTLTTSEMPSHSHSIKTKDVGGAAGSGTTNPSDAQAFNSSINHYAASSLRRGPLFNTTSDNAAYNVINTNGQGQPHNNMPPYSTGIWIIFTNVFKIVNNYPFNNNDKDYFV